MCWFGERNAVLKIAEEDINVFKIAIKSENTIISAYKGFQYKIEQLYETEINLEKGYTFASIDKGFHSYSNKCRLIKGCSHFGYSAFRIMFKTRLLDSFGRHAVPYCRVDCIIPKGSQYYENEYGEIVSNKIILKKVIDDQ